jgi:putative membrane protein
MSEHPPRTKLTPVTEIDLFASPGGDEAEPRSSPTKVHRWRHTGSLILFLSTLAGVVLFLLLISRQGGRQVAEVVASARWGILVLVGYHAIPLCLDGFSWWILFPKRQRPRLGRLLWVRWIGEAVTNLLPVSSLGGDIVRARWITDPGIPLRITSGTVVVNITMGVLSQIGFTLFGIGLLARTTGASLGALSAWNMLFLMLAIGAFCGLQHFGIFRLLKIITASLAQAPGISALLAAGDRMDAAIREMYADHRSIAISFGWSVAYWVSGCIEVWIALYSIGVRASLTNALIIESAIQGVRSAAFFLPGSLGVQEGGYLIVCKLLGIPGDAALALSLIRRARELILGVPGLIAWQILEFGRRYSVSRPAAAQDAPLEH